MDALSLRLGGDGSFNLESALNPLKDHISSAIMQYHTNGEDTMHKVFDEKTGCGQPSSMPARTKRSTQKIDSSVRVRRRASIGLKTLVDNVKARLRDVKYLWRHNSLAGTMCSPISATTGQQCWNGESEALYSKPLIGSGLEENNKNPEVTVDPTSKDPIMEKQLSQLREVTATVINATLGNGNLTWLNLQLALPNVSSDILGEGRAVKSDWNRLPPMADSGSGSGGFNPDDEDSTMSGDGSFPSTTIPLTSTDDESSGSGDSSPLGRYPGRIGSINVDPELPDEITIPPPVHVANPQPDVGLPEQRYLDKTTVIPSRSAPTGSSNCLTSTPPILILSTILLLITAHFSLL